jgi:hypothetical protein
MRRGVPLVVGTAIVGAAASFEASALADGPPQLPPPPPPPLGQTQPPPATSSSSSAKKTTAATSTSTSASATTSTDQGSAGSSSGATAFDTRWHLEVMLGLSTDYLDFGLGLRGGKTLDNHIYIGGSLVNHFLGSGGYGTGSLFYFGPEGGYDFDLKAVVLRAYLGLGLAFFSAGPANATRFVVWPGASVIWNIPASNFFIGGDVRFVSVPNGPAVGFFAMGGLHFGS